MSIDRELGGGDGETLLSSKFTTLYPLLSTLSSQLATDFRKRSITTARSSYAFEELRECVVDTPSLELAKLALVLDLEL
jgi:hypothetical protein